MKHDLNDGKPPLVLDVPTCIHDCPWFRNAVGTCTCNQDKKNIRKMSLKDVTDAKRNDYPNWCPLEYSLDVPSKKTKKESAACKS